jgi:uncharacterized membrane protein
VQQPDEHRLEVMIGTVLRVGVLLSALVVAGGGAVFILRHGWEHANYTVFRGEPAELRTIGGILAEAFSFSGRDIIQLGLLTLIATPVIRVGFSAYAFARLGDYKYVGITLIVFALLLYSLFGVH